MAIVLMVQVPIHHVAIMTRMCNLRVPAIGSVDVSAGMSVSANMTVSAGRGILSSIQRMLVNMALVLAVQLSIVDVSNVIIMLNLLVPAVVSMGVGVVCFSLAGHF